jgi:hypothetical protein
VNPTPTRWRRNPLAASWERVHEDLENDLAGDLDITVA